MSREAANGSCPCGYGALHFQSCTPEIVNELDRDSNNSNSLDKGQVSQATQDQCCSEESSLTLDEACTILALREGAVKNCGHSLLLSFPERSLSNFATMCSIYQMFTSAQQVLDQQFTRPVRSWGELLLPACHPRGSAECPHSLPEEDMGQRFQEELLNILKPLPTRQPPGQETTHQEQPLNKFATLVRKLRRAWKGLPIKGVVLYLGTFLTDLLMLETAVENYLEGKQINYSKKNKEYRVLTDIMLLQAVAENYCLEPQHPFTAWFWAVERLSEDDRCILSCQQNTSTRTTGHSQIRAEPIASARARIPPRQLGYLCCMGHICTRPFLSTND